MGAGIAASPHCAERRICRCSIYLGPAPTNGFVTPLLDPGSPAQASLSIRPLPPKRSPDRPTDGNPEDHQSFDRPGLAETKAVRCSAALLGSTALASRFTLHAETLRAASRLRKDDSSGASYRLTPHPLRRASATPAGGDRNLGTYRTHLAVAGFPGRLEPPSRSQRHHAPRFRVGEVKNAVTSLWITGILGTTIGTFSRPRLGGRFGCRSVLLRLPPPSA